MRIIILSNNDNVKPLYTWLKNKEKDVMLHDKKITQQLLDDIHPDFVISYNYRFIVENDIINRMGNNIINMHISYLPWNKGANPNIWSFIDDTPKGVTIHRLERGLDTGKIIVQKEIHFNEDVDTLSSSYEKLNVEIVELFKENWDMISQGNYEMKDHVGEGSYHKSCDLERLLHGKDIDYNMTIESFKNFIKNVKN